MELPITRIVFTGTNPQGEFVAGDVVEVFVETTEIIVPSYFGFQGIRVKKNGSYVSSGAYIDFADKPYKNVQYFNTSICIGTYKVYFAYLVIPTYPYFTYLTEDGHPSCNISAPVCNLVIVGQPDIIPATGQNEADGSVIITATSSNAIRYKIGSDFAYADGTGQDENTFSELLPGEYKIYLVDTNNCKTNITVTIPISNVYNTIYRLQYNDIIGGSTRIDIGRRGYLGSITEVCGSGSPLSIQMRGEGEDDKFTSILATESVVELLTSFDGQFRELYTNDPDLYHVTVYKSDINQFDSFDPFDSIPLSTWTNVEAPGFATSWQTGISEPTVETANDSDYLSSPISGIEPGEYFLYVRAAATSRFTISVFFRDGTSTVGTATQVFSNGETNILYVGISGVPDNVRIQVDTTGSLTALRRFTIQSLSMPVTLRPLWSGKVIPGIIEEQYSAPPYVFTIRATDGLPGLKDIYLMHDDGQKFEGKISLIKLIAYCLSKTKVVLNIRVGCNIYADSMTTTASSDPLEQAYLDFDLFYLSDERPTLEYVLRIILDAFGARLVQWGGYWNILRVEETVGEIDYRIFDTNGVYVSNGSLNPLLDLGYPEDDTDLMHVNADQNLEIRPGFGTIRVIYDLGYKDNILKNGDFKLKSDFNSAYNTYILSVNTDGFTLYTGTRPKRIGYRRIEDGNVALEIGMPFQLNNINPGWTESDTYFFKMGTNIQLRFYIRYSVESTTAYRSTNAWVYTFGPNYVKLRIIITYGPLYLGSDGNWLGDPNEIIVFVSDYNKFQDFEILASAPYFLAYDQFYTYPQSIIVSYNGKNWKSLQFNNIGHTPASGAWWQEITMTPSTGMNFRVRVYDADVFYAEYTSLDVLKAAPTVNRQVGYRTEIWGNETGHGNGGTWMDYYTLEEGTDSELSYEVIRPDDFNASTNPKVYRHAGMFPLSSDVNYQAFLIDKIQVTYLRDGNEPVNTIVRDRDGERNNKSLYVKDFKIGSFSTVTVTNLYVGFGSVFYSYINLRSISGTLTFQTITENIESPELIFAGYLRSSLGVGYENWARDGIAESDKLHGIMLRTYAAQYKKSWRRMRGSFYSNKTYFGLINTVSEVNANNRIYLPISISIDDKNNIYSGEMLELTNIYENPGSDGSGEAPYSSGFTTGFGASGFN